MERRAAQVVVVCAALVLASACSIGGDDSPGSAAPSASPSSTPDEQDSGPLVVPDEDPPPCADVRAGIDAYNQGRPEDTVRRFTEAIPAAELYDAQESSRTSRLLLEAVRYYAALPPEDYVDSLKSSPEFKRHQIVTLAVCRYDAPSSPALPSDDAQTA